MGKKRDSKVNLEKIIKEKENLLSQMHHDIKTPLNGITGLVYLIRQNLDEPQKIAAYLAKLEEASEELKNQVEAVFALSRLVEEGINPAKRIVDLDEIASSGRMTETSGETKEVQQDFEDQTEGAVSLAGKRVLIAEDNEINLVITSEILESWGCRIDTARDGMEAVRKFRDSQEGTFDFILMDIRMPNMDGYEAVEKIRGLARGDAQQVTIIALTANAYQAEAEKVRICGMDGIITKPLHVSALRHLMCISMDRERENPEILN